MSKPYYRRNTATGLTALFTNLWLWFTVFLLFILARIAGATP